MGGVQGLRSSQRAIERPRRKEEESEKERALFRGTAAELFFLSQSHMCFVIRAGEE